MQMAEYYRNRPSATASGPAVVDGSAGAATSTETVYISEYDRQREALLSDDLEEGWASELRRYLGVVQRDVKKDTDLVKWWQVSDLFISYSSLTVNSLQDHAQLFPTLARIALDVLPSQASSVACERIFSGSKQIATDRRSRLGQVIFEKLVIMKSAWGPDLCDMAAWNASQVEGINNTFDFEEMLAEDVDCATWDDLYKGWDDEEEVVEEYQDIFSVVVV